MNEYDKSVCCFAFLLVDINIANQTLQNGNDVYLIAGVSEDEIRNVLALY